MNERYSPANMALHWAMAGVMIAGFVLGEIMEDMPRGPEKLTVMGWHVLAGLTIAALVIPRILARLRGTPALPPAMPLWERRLATAGHLVLYAVMLALPFTGLIAIITGGRAFPVLGLFEIPALGPVPGIHGGMETVHGILSKLFLGTLVLHVLATLWHALVRRDGIAGRMMPVRTRPEMSHNSLA